MHESVKRELK